MHFVTDSQSLSIPNIVRISFEQTNAIEILAGGSDANNFRLYPF